MKKYKNIILVPFVLAALFLAGCTEKFDEPGPYKPWVDSNFTHITPISELKQIFYDEFGNTSAQLNKYVVIEDDIVIKGKVISNDMYGNVYRSLFIQDETGAIEIKVGLGSMYNTYHVGQTVYCRAKGLYLGNYRFNLSLGAASVDQDYANGYINVESVIDNILLRGEMTKLTAADTLVITDQSQLRDPEDLNRLVRFEGMVSKWGSGEGYGDGFSSSDVYPSFLESVEGNYNNYLFTDVIEAWKAYHEAYKKWEEDPENNPKPDLPVSPEPATDYPTWAFKSGDNSYYGSSLFVQGNGGYVVRTSGYSRFALFKLPEDGTKVTMTAILTKYSSRTGGFQKYQLTLNTVADVKVVE